MQKVSLRVTHSVDISHHHGRHRPKTPLRVCSALGCPVATSDEGLRAAGDLTGLRSPTSPPQVVDARVMDAVRRSGFAVVDGALGTHAARALGAEAASLGAQADTREVLMRLNCTHFVTAEGANLLRKVRWEPPAPTLKGWALPSPTASSRMAHGSAC